MKVEIWINALVYSFKEWRIISKVFIEEEDNGLNYIIVNHRFKEYRKNFWCTKHQLTSIIKKAKTMKESDIIDFTI